MNFRIQRCVNQTSLFISLALLFSFCLFFRPQPAPAREAAPPSHILMINSYHQSLEWEKDIFRAVQEVLQPGKNNIQLHIENMDTKRVPYTDEFKEKLVALYRHKYASLDFSLIIATDDNAFNLMRQYRNDLFPGVPVVFCGVNFFREHMLEGYPGFAGVAETFDAGATLKTALELHPETENVLVINDYLPTGRAWTQTIKTELEDLSEKLNITYAGNLSMADLLRSVRQLPEKSIILYGVYFRDRLNRFYTPKESTALISGASPVPVYGLLDFNLGHGIIGGKLISGYFQGRAAALIAQQVLAGRDPGQIPVMKNAANHYMFDHDQLARWKINTARLPDGAVIINRPGSFYRDHKVFVWQISGFFALMAMVIFALALTIRRRKKAENRLRQLHKTLAQKVKDRTRALHSAMEFSEKTSRELMMTSARMQSILDNSPIGIIFASKDREIKQVNSEIVSLSGYDYDELIGKNTEKFFMSPQSWKEFGKKAYPVLLNHETYETRIQFRKKDGATLWCHLQGRLVFQGDETRGIIWILRDISESMAAEKEKQIIAKKLEQAQRYKSLNTMAGAIAHHYNNIMMSVQGNIELLRMGLSKSSKAHQLATSALESAHKASMISTSMLTYVGQQKMEARIMEFNSLISDTCDLLRNNVRETTGITMVQSPSPLFCRMDPAQITEVLLNLVMNADEAVEGENGQITLKTFATNIDHLEHPTPFRDVALKPGRYICCEISDNGSGIDLDTADHIFEPFFTTKFTGRGLGLSIVAGIVKAHSGTMQIKSSPGKGSCISIFLPVELSPESIESRQPEKETPDAAIPEFSGTVILADDNLEVGRIGEKLLRRLGFNVILASDGQEAVDQYINNRPLVTLLLLDAVMPNMNGVEAMTRIKSIDSSANIILVSGYSQDQIKMNNAPFKPDMFIQKPYRLNKLITAVSMVLEAE
ncbi:MAG: ATP-binding protein [Desulfobacterales bacterium]|nr:ATP-binding protein [Desulfobacterales bacterium]